MTSELTRLSPLGLPATDYEHWLGQRCDDHLAIARQIITWLKSESRPGDEVLRLWNDIHVALTNAFTIANLMAQVHPEESVRTRAEVAVQDADRLGTDIGLDRELFDVLDAVDGSGFDEQARRVLALSLRDFRRSGVDRDQDVRDRLRQLAEEETLLGQEVAKNIRDGALTIKVRPDDLEGLPQDFLDSHPVGEDGLVTLSTDRPDYVPVMTFVRSREVRKQMLDAYLNRAWPQNDPVLHKLFSLRNEHAQLLGYADWPSYDAEVKMIGDGPSIMDFIDRITERAAESAGRDFDVLLLRRRVDDPTTAVLDGTDRAFYSEIIRRENFDVDAQEVREYFDFTKVRAGLLDVTARLFGLEYVEVPDAPVWHDEVTVYDVSSDGSPLGRIYLDLHPRANKYSHAACFDLVPGITGRQLPEGVLVCNFSRGLMEHDDVVTLFHEFGHLVHHILAGRHQWARFSGIATEWDFVEAPSQMFEEWAWDAEVLRSFATNAAGEPIPAALVEKMRRAEDFGKGLQARTQMFYAALAYTCHQQVPDDLTAQVQAMQSKYDLFSYVPGTHFHTAFGHLVDYSSGYYTYMWSLVIAKDLFSAFSRDDMFDTSVAHRYRDRVLAAGGSKPAAELVEDFLGRPYNFDAFEAWLAEGY